jgi:hypothetical protein
VLDGKGPREILETSRKNGGFDGKNIGNLWENQWKTWYGKRLHGLNGCFVNSMGFSSKP